MSKIFSVPLQEIDKAIRMNCLVEKNSIKPLTLVKDQQVKNKGVGRSLFIFIAVKAGYTPELICDYLGIKIDEFESRLVHSYEYFNIGQELFNAYTPATNYKETKDTYLFFYRKLILATNYLKYRYDFVI